MTEQEKKTLEEKARQIRYLLMDALGSLGLSAHVGGSLSIADVLAVLYFKHMNIDPKDPKKPGRDRFVLSKGHAGPALYATLALRGYFPTADVFKINSPNTYLPSHVDMTKTPGVDMTAGSLGQGVSCALGLAYGSRLAGDGAYVYSIVGDGESQEGQVWECAMMAAELKLDHFICFTDYNKQQLDGPLNTIINISPLAEKWKAFGWNVINVEDGNDVAQIDDAIVAAKKNTGKPTMILLNTIKGKGVSFIEKKWNHSILVSPEERVAALEELKA